MMRNRNEEDQLYRPVASSSGRSRRRQALRLGRGQQLRRIQVIGDARAAGIPLPARAGIQLVFVHDQLNVEESAVRQIPTAVSTRLLPDDGSIAQG